MGIEPPFVSALRDLLDEGRLRLASPLVAPPEDVEAAHDVIALFEQRYRMEMPGEAPAYSPNAALWAAQMFHRAAQCLAFRAIDEAGMKQMLSLPFVGMRDASADYSVDLTFRLLPDLVQRARAASREDPLVERLLEWANEWPLSSVGITGVQPKDLEPILQHPSLRILYADRVLATKDLTRLNDPRVREAVNAAIGLHEELATEVNEAMKAFAGNR